MSKSVIQNYRTNDASISASINKLPSGKGALSTLHALSRGRNVVTNARHSTAMRGMGFAAGLDCHRNRVGVALMAHSENQSFSEKAHSKVETSEDKTNFTIIN